LIAEDTRSDYGEPRLLVMALFDDRLHTMVVTPRGEDLRVISFRKTNRRKIRDGMAKKTRDRASRPDDENPEWTKDDFPRARPAAEVLQEFIGKKATEELMRRSRGRPPKADKKVNQTLRLDPDVLDAFRQQGSGWQARINQAREVRAGSDKNWRVKRSTNFFMTGSCEPSARPQLAP
jgi:uncharacterized protein (DUF4415 family)